MKEEEPETKIINDELLDANKNDHARPTGFHPMPSAIKGPKASKKGVLISEKVENCTISDF